MTNNKDKLIKTFIRNPKLIFYSIIGWYYHQKRWKYSRIMTAEFIGGVSLSVNFYKFKKYKNKQEYYEKRIKQYFD